VEHALDAPAPHGVALGLDFGEAWVAELAQSMQFRLGQASVRGEGLHSKASLSEALLDLGFKGCGHSVRSERSGNS
jgi:hypothetical protein